MKKVAVITVLRNADFYLKKWVEYYGSNLGYENLYVYFDGEDQEIIKLDDRVHVGIKHRKDQHLVAAEKERAKFISDKANILLDSYDLVIATDIDEFIVPDPNVSNSLLEFLSNTEIKSTISALGVDVTHDVDTEPAIDSTKPILSQRSYAYLSTRYTKPSIISKKLSWGSGLHRIKGHNFHICPNLYLFHFGYCDRGLIEERMADQSLIKQGWKKHLKKRTNLVSDINKSKTKSWDKWVNIARKMQTYIRLPYAWNKPAMLNVKVLVSIPERFKDIV